jgi:hypothetical protein
MALRTELVDQAFILEQQRRLDAADVLMATANRIGEICDEVQAVLPAKRSLGARINRPDC